MSNCTAELFWERYPNHSGPGSREPLSQGPFNKGREKGDGP